MAIVWVIRYQLTISHLDLSGCLSLCEFFVTVLQRFVGQDSDRVSQGKKEGVVYVDCGLSFRLSKLVLEIVHRLQTLRHSWQALGCSIHLASLSSPIQSEIKTMLLDYFCALKLA